MLTEPKSGLASRNPQTGSESHATASGEQARQPPTRLPGFEWRPPRFSTATSALDGTYDELVEAAGATRQHAQMVASLLAKMTADTFARCQALAELALAQRGVTFSVYSDDRGTEKVMPVCLVPRVIAAAEWARLERGLDAAPAAACRCSSTISTASRRCSRPG